MSTKPMSPLTIQMAANNERINAAEADYRCALMETDHDGMTAARAKLHSLLDQKLDLLGAAATKIMRGEL